MEEQVHLTDVIKTGVESIDVHTYYAGDDMLALFDVFGSTTDTYERSNIELWINEDQVRAIRDALNKILGES